MENTITLRDIESLIFEFRGMKVMVDTNLASMYETETKKLKQQVRRNLGRFPNDFMFELTTIEKEQLISQVPRLAMLKHSSVNPMVFTEQGVAMLSSVLRTDKAVQMNIGIMRAFAYYRKMLLDNKELKKEIQKLDAKLNKAFKYLLDQLDALTPKLEEKPRKKIGYKRSDEE
jgi:ORF6N domain